MTLQCHHGGTPVPQWWDSGFTVVGLKALCGQPEIEIQPFRKIVSETAFFDGEKGIVSRQKTLFSYLKTFFQINRWQFATLFVILHRFM